MFVNIYVGFFPNCLGIETYEEKYKKIPKKKKYKKNKM